jgi:hypothetical protein
LQGPAHIAEEPADLILAGGHAPFRKIDLGIAGEQIENGLARRCHATVVEGLEVFERHRLSLLVRHRHLRQCH